MKFRRDTCRRIRDLLPLHVSGDLPPSKSARAEEHLCHCLPCFREFRELTTLRERLGVLTEQPLPEGALDGFTEEVMARIALDDAGPSAPLPEAAGLPELPSDRPWARYAAAAGLVLGLGLALRGLETWLPPAGAPAASGHEALVDAAPEHELPEVAEAAVPGFDGMTDFTLPAEGPRHPPGAPPVFDTEVVSGTYGRVRPWTAREGLAPSMSEMVRGLLDAAGAQALPALRHSGGWVPEPDRKLRPRREH